MNTEILAPAAALAIWSMIMLIWMAATRLPALKRLSEISGSPVTKKPGGRGQDLEGRIPDEINWKAHNYNHLMEQPTVFYPVIVILALVGASSIDVTLAWAYVGLRIAHSFWQALVNTIPVRITLFSIYSIILAILSVRALLATI